MKSKPQSLTLPREVDPFLRNQLERELLKYTAGRVMSCPACGELLDCERTTVFTVHGVPEGKASEEIVATYVQCASCWDERGSGAAHSILKLATRKPELKIRTELVDGRTVFAEEKA